MSIIKPNRDEFQNILQRLERVPHEHNVWLLSWHRNLLCTTATNVHSITHVTEGSHLYCDFGKWYHHQPPPYLAQFPIFKQMGLLHINMHSIANRLLQQGFSENIEFLTEYDAFLKARSEFLDLVEVLEIELSGMLLHIDSITQIIDHRKMISRLYQCQERLEIQQENSTLCLLKLDYPHPIYDGHVQPDDDQLILDIAHFLATHLRAGDMIFRSCADEFLITLVNLSLPTASSVIERLRIAFNDRNNSLTRTFSQVAVSFGVAPLEVGVAVEESITRARQALHTARAQCHKRIAYWKASMAISNDPPHFCVL